MVELIAFSPRFARRSRRIRDTLHAISYLIRLRRTFGVSTVSDIKGEGILVKEPIIYTMVAILPVFVAKNGTERYCYALPAAGG